MSVNQGLPSPAACNVLSCCCVCMSTVASLPSCASGGGKSLPRLAALFGNQHATSLAVLDGSRWGSGDWALLFSLPTPAVSCGKDVALTSRGLTPVAAADCEDGSDRLVHPLSDQGGSQ